MSEERRKGDRRVPPALAQFALDKLTESGDQAAIDLTVQNVEILRAEIERRDARIAELEAQRNAWKARSERRIADIKLLVERHAAEIAALKAQPSAGVRALPSSSELIELTKECSGMKGGVGMLHENYAREVLRRWGQPSAGVVLPEPFEMRPFQTVDQGSTNYKAGFNAAIRKVRESLNPCRATDGMVSVTQADANNYCLILSELGMEEEGDPVAEVKRLIRQEGVR